MNKHSIELESIISFCNLTLDNIQLHNHPDTIYKPINHILNVKGKGVRSHLACISYSMLNGRLSKIKKLVLAIETFHTFTLIHDDIMDNALLRRGSPTINNKWSNNQALLSGDVLLMHAYDYLLELPFRQIDIIKIVKLFNTTAIKICKGQQLDLDMQQLKIVSLQDYFSMIDLKTSELIVFSLIAPYLLCQTNISLNLVTEIGYNLGRLFQIQDDYLDLYGEQKKTGKTLGGDVKEGKKTFLYIVALEHLRGAEKEELIEIYNSSPSLSNETKKSKFNQKKLFMVRELYKKINLQKLVLLELDKLGLVTLELIMKLDGEIVNKNLFIEFFETILHRKL